jgi:hypothetical protein
MRVMEFIVGGIALVCLIVAFGLLVLTLLGYQ